MNLFSTLPKGFEFFTSLMVGSFSIWCFLLMSAISVKNVKVLSGLTSLFIVLEKSQNSTAEFNWLFIFILVLASYILGEFFLALGDLFLTYKFRGKPLKVEEFIFALWRKRKFPVERIAPSVTYPVLTADTFLSIEESYQTKKSEYYYSRSNMFAGIFISFIMLVSIPFFFDDTLDIKIKPLLLLWLISCLWLTIRERGRFLSLVFYFILVPSPAFWIFESINQFTAISNSKNALEIITLLMIILFTISYLLANTYREQANLFLYIAYLKSKEKQKPKEPHTNS